MVVQKKHRNKKTPVSISWRERYSLLFDFSFLQHPDVLIEQTNPLCHAIPSLSDLPDHGHCIRNLDIVRFDIKIISRR